MARACPGVRELSVVHVSPTSVSLLLRVTDENVGHGPYNPPTNKVREWAESGLPILKRTISAFKNLSTIVLIHRVGRRPKGYTGWIRGRSGPLWKEVKDLAIDQLKCSSAGGPKKLKIGPNPCWRWKRSFFENAVVCRMWYYWIVVTFFFLVKDMECYS